MLYVPSSLHGCFHLFFDHFHLLFDLLQCIQGLFRLPQLGPERVDISPQYGNFELAFCTCLGKDLAAFILDLFESFFNFLRLYFQPVACLLQLLPFSGGAVAFLADVVQQLVGAQVFGVDLSAGPSR